MYVVANFCSAPQCTAKNIAILNQPSNMRRKVISCPPPPSNQNGILSKVLTYAPIQYMNFLQDNSKDTKRRISDGLEIVKTFVCIRKAPKTGLRSFTKRSEYTDDFEISKTGLRSFTESRVSERFRDY